MNSLQKFDTYSKRYLNDWDNKSTVRSHRKNKVQIADLSEVKAPFLIKPFLEFPEIQKLEEWQFNPLYIQCFCNNLYSVSRFEVNLVTTQCIKLANQDNYVEMTDSIRQVALAIGVDETYHALIASQLLSELKEVSGCLPSIPKSSGAQKPAESSLSEIEKKGNTIDPLESFRKSVPAHLERIAEIVMLCIAENSVVDDLIDMGKDLGTKKPFAIYMREHMLDESRHKIYFQHLLEYIWVAISEQDRINLGEALAAYYERTLHFDYENVYQSSLRVLGYLGLEESIKTKIAEEVARKTSSMSLCDQEIVKKQMRLNKIAGITLHPPTKKLFIEKGFITNDSISFA